MWGMLPVPVEDSAIPDVGASVIAGLSVTGMDIVLIPTPPIRGAGCILPAPCNFKNRDLQCETL